MSTHILPELPYEPDALEPHISKETLDYHYNRHHATYVNKLNEMIKGTRLEGKTLEELIRGSNSGKVYNNAAQAWNHAFYWRCMTPNRNTGPSGKFEEAVARSFGSMNQMKREFAEAAAGQFGSGWAWLIKNISGSILVMTTDNADSPIIFDYTPLLVCDVWEHAYYIDYRNDRAAYIEKFIEVINWEFVTENYDARSISDLKAA